MPVQASLICLACEADAVGDGGGVRHSGVPQRSRRQDGLAGSTAGLLQVVGQAVAGPGGGGQGNDPAGRRGSSARWQGIRRLRSLRPSAGSEVAAVTWPRLWQGMAHSPPSGPSVQLQEAMAFGTNRSVNQ
jgi:hypothetical protein